MRVAGLFAGAGGMETGFARAGAETALLAENDPAARAVLERRFPGAAKAGDVAALDRLPRGTNAVTAGFPCQDLSAAGSKAGIGGARSGLVSHVFRLLATAPDAEWLVLENVPFMLSLDRGAAMEKLAGMLEAAGWAWAYRTLDAICVLPQRRRRVILVASPVHDPREALFADGFEAPDDRSWKPGGTAGFYWTEGRDGAGLRNEAIPPLKIGSGKGIPSAPAILPATGPAGTPSIRDAERLQGFEAGWTEAAEGMKGSQRWKLVGNAAPPPLAEWTARAVMAPKGVDGRASDGPMPARGRWPGAAAGNASGRHAVRIGEAFAPGPRPRLSDFLRDPLKPLSERALSGFLGRARRGCIRWPEGFLERLEGRD